jgi:hypothetical protein
VPPTADQLLASRIGELQDRWLDVTCVCRSTSKLPLKLLAKRHGNQRLLSWIIPRLKCSRCSARPTLVLALSSVLVDPDHGDHGPDSWIVRLV